MAQTSADDLKTTPLLDRHVAANGRMVPFGGYALPVQYPTGIMAEHKWCREQAGLFDVSHMGPSFLVLANPSGDTDADHAAIAAIIEPLICGDIAGLKPGQVRYTILLNATGGALDDLMVARAPTDPGTLYIVVNAGTKDADFALIAKAAGEKVSKHADIRAKTPDELKDQLTGYKTTAHAIQFTLDTILPSQLIEDLVRVHVREIDANRQ